MELGNLVNLGHKEAWNMMELQNQKYLGEYWNTTQDKISMDEDYYMEGLPQRLQEWLEYQIDNQTETFLLVQAVGMDMEQLQKVIEKEIYSYEVYTLGLTPKLEHIGYAWHLLHTEQ